MSQIIHDAYRFKSETIDDMKHAVKSVLAVCKLGEVWGQKFESIKVWRRKPHKSDSMLMDKKYSWNTIYQFEGCLYYSYPRWDGD